MSVAPMTPLEVLAVVRLRQWFVERAELRNGKTTSYKRVGWAQRRSSRFDAKIVRCIDFERAYGHLCPSDQALLELVYAEDWPNDQVAKILCISERSIYNYLPHARALLAHVLDKAGLI